MAALESTNRDVGAQLRRAVMKSELKEVKINAAAARRKCKAEHACKSIVDTWVLGEGIILPRKKRIDSHVTSMTIANPFMLYLFS